MHRINRGAIDLAIGSRQAREAGEAPRAQSGDGLCRGDATAAAHHFYEHWLAAIRGLAIERDPVMAIFAGRALSSGKPACDRDR